MLSALLMQCVNTALVFWVSIMYVSFNFLVWWFFFFEVLAAVYGDTDREGSHIQEIQHVTKFTEQKTVESSRYFHFCFHVQLLSQGKVDGVCSCHSAVWCCG